ncbi:hypothetical protein LXL04_026861 [Taraxacum kok-saghyz]
MEAESMGDFLGSTWKLIVAKKMRIDDRLWLDWRKKWICGIVIGKKLDSAPIAPLELESPIGQFLSQILVSHPHLLPAAVEQQLEQLQTDRDAQQQTEQPSAQTTDLVLYKKKILLVPNNNR